MRVTMPKEITSAVFFMNYGQKLFNRNNLSKRIKSEAMRLSIMKEFSLTSSLFLPKIERKKNRNKKK